MKFKEILNILPKYYDNSGYNINIKNINIPDYQNNNVDMFNWKLGKQEFSSKILNSEVKEIRNGDDQILIYIDYKLN